MTSTEVDGTGEPRPLSERAGQFFLGCAVWAFPGWLGDFYPRGTAPRDFLSAYAQRLTAVEGNTTFYSVPAPEMVERWAAATPESFCFCPKLPNALTHQGPLAPSIGGARAFLRRMEPLGPRLRLVFAQLPATYGPEQVGDLASFVESWPHERVPLAVELRHRAWFEDEHHAPLIRTLEGAGVAKVVLDSRPVYEGPDDPQARSQRRKPRLPVRAEPTAPACMVRYIGHPDIERNLPHLERWSARVAQWLRQGHDVHFFCHCPIEEHSPHLARLFQPMVEQRGGPVRPLPWSELAPLPEQLGLFD